MPDLLRTPFDKPVVPSEGLLTERTVLPRSGFEAALRGARNRCPRCGLKRLFVPYLKPVAVCSVCGQDWSHQRADDFPAYLAILITGHILAPVVVALVTAATVPLWLLAIIILTGSASLLALLLQPAKGVVIAVQWWLGMHGFVRPRGEE